MSLTIHVAGQRALEEALDQWGAEVAAPRQLFVNLVSDVIVPDIRSRFDRRGPGWRALNPLYAAWKAVHYPGKGILERTGALRARLTDASRFGGAQSSFGPNTLTIDPQLPYFAAHQLGTKRIPQRQMVDLEALRLPVGAYVTRWLDKRARDFGFQVRGE